METGYSKSKKKKSVPRKRKQILVNLSKFPNKLQNDAGKPKLNEDLEKIIKCSNIEVIRGRERRGFSKIEKILT